jgi:hypothetical protein
MIIAQEQWVGTRPVCGSMSINIHRGIEQPEHENPVDVTRQSGKCVVLSADQETF